MKHWVKGLWLVVVLLLVACGGMSPTPDTGLPPGWKPAGDAQAFDAETLYDLVDGQADAFFAYAFEQATVQTYENDEGDSLRVEIWQLATPSDAYGLFSTYRAGTPVEIGNEGDSDPGRRLDFWQDRSFVRVFAFQPLPDDELLAPAQATANTLPTGGERPALLDRLPQARQVERSDIFFHEEISIQSVLWLGGENLLGLGPETDGVLARYELDDGTGHLLLVQYPGDDEAATALAALQSGSVPDLVAARSSGRLLGAVFGPIGEPEAGTLLLEVLEEE